MFQGLFAQPIPFPVAGTPLTDAVSLPTSLLGGAASVSRFTIAGGIDGFVSLTAPGGGAVAAPITLTVVRLK
jgi:hypothetical protein